LSVITKKSNYNLFAHSRRAAVRNLEVAKNNQIEKNFAAGTGKQSALIFNFSGGQSGRPN
jgi:hypothetical protein